MLTMDLWDAMKADLKARILPSDTLISGGAAWADHLAVHAYLAGWCKSLHLQLPAPMNADRFLGPFKSAGSAANYYHELFSKAIGENTCAQIRAAVDRGATFECEPEAPGVRAMFVRNAKVASACTGLIAYTFGEGDVPADGGTKDTWDKVKTGFRMHLNLRDVLQSHQHQMQCPSTQAPEPVRQMSRAERFSR